MTRDQGWGTQTYQQPMAENLMMGRGSLCKSQSVSSQMEGCKAKHTAGAGLQQGDVQMTSSQSYWLADRSTAEF